MALKYYSEFEQENTRPEIRTTKIVRIEISDVDYVGDPMELLLEASPLNINYTNTGDNKIEPLRGSQASINFIASDTFHLEDLYTDQEMKFIVSIYLDGVVIWKGFVIPDGCSENFIDPPYIVTVRAIDGIGVLKNIPFVNNIYDIYDHRKSVLDIFQMCLVKTELNMGINTFAKIHHSNMTELQDPFSNTVLIIERFAPEGKIMNCADVIESLLIEYGCSIVQHNGEWFIYRVSDVAKYNGELFCFKYSSLGVFIETFNIDINLLLGNNNGDVIHCNGDQIRAVDNAYKRVEIFYEYGQIDNLLIVGQRFLEGISNINFSDWLKNGGIDALPKFGLVRNNAIINGRHDVNQYISLINPEPISVSGRMGISINFNVGDGNGLPFVIKYQSSTKTLYWNPSEEVWQTAKYVSVFYNEKEVTFGTGIITFGVGTNAIGTVEFDTPPLDPDGTLDIFIHASYYRANNPVPVIVSPGLANIFEVKLYVVPDNDSAISETHTVINNNNYTTVPSRFEVHAGEPPSKMLVGTMFDADGIIPTNGWRENGDSGVYVNFLEIASKNIMKLYNRPMRKYEGTIYGYFDYFSIFTIENLSGKFIPISLSYDMKRNQILSTLIEIDNTTLPVSYTVDYNYNEEKQVGVEGV